MMEQPTANECILIVDDDADMCALISFYLEDAGFNTITAENGKEALEKFEKTKPNLVLTDLNMPVMNGLELINALQEISPETPVVVVSGERDMSDAINAMHFGAWDYIIKPFTKESLEHSVCSILERFRLITENKKYRLQLEKNNIQLTQNFQQLESDQKAGKAVQQLLLPKSPIFLDGYSFSHKVIPSLYLSGDFVDYFKINDEKLGFYIVDVSGHGASSAFVAVLLRGLMEQIKGMGEIILHPEKTLKLISDYTFNVKLGKYLTMIYCVLDIRENIMQYCIGGHYPSPILWDGRSSTFLKGKGFPVGVHLAAEFECIRCELPSHFSLFMFSDGILEIMKGKNLDENEAKLLEIASKSSCVDDFLNALQIHNKEGFPDDITLMMVNKEDLFARR